MEYKPVEIIGDQEAAVKFMKTKLKKTDIRGREIPVIVPNSEKIIKCDSVILAFGFRPNPQSWFKKIRSLLTKLESKNQ